jgi:hypothetical protein
VYDKKEDQMNREPGRFSYVAKSREWTVMGCRGSTRAQTTDEQSNDVSKHLVVSRLVDFYVFRVVSYF